MCKRCSLLWMSTEGLISPSAWNWWENVTNGKIIRRYIQFYKRYTEPAKCQQFVYVSEAGNWYSSSLEQESTLLQSSFGYTVGYQLVMPNWWKSLGGHWRPQDRCTVTRQRRLNYCLLDTRYGWRRGMWGKYSILHIDDCWQRMWEVREASCYDLK